MIFSWSPSVHFKHILFVRGARGVTKRFHRNNGLFSERISFYPLLFPSECHGTAYCWAPNISVCSGHVECLFGLFSASVSCSLYTFILVLNKVTRCGGLLRWKISFFYFSCQLPNLNMHKMAGKPPLVPTQLNLLSVIYGLNRNSGHHHSLCHAKNGVSLYCTRFFNRGSLI